MWAPFLRLGGTSAAAWLLAGDSLYLVLHRSVSPKALKEGDRFAMSSTDSYGVVALTTGLRVRMFA
jgi:hypothetical protein